PTHGGTRTLCRAARSLGRTGPRSAHPGSPDHAFFRSVLRGRRRIRNARHREHGHSHATWFQAALGHGALADRKYRSRRFRRAVASLCSSGALLLPLKFWQPKEPWEQGKSGGRPGQAPRAPPGESATEQLAAQQPAPETGDSSARIRQAWVPWILLSLLVFLW